jgi:hypothetical protein
MKILVVSDKIVDIIYTPSIEERMASGQGSGFSLITC